MVKGETKKINKGRMPPMSRRNDATEQATGGISKEGAGDEDCIRYWICQLFTL
jgi:hypothetical protein